MTHEGHGDEIDDKENAIHEGYPKTPKPQPFEISVSSHPIIKIQSFATLLIFLFGLFALLAILQFYYAVSSLLLGLFPGFSGLICFFGALPLVVHQHRPLSQVRKSFLDIR